MNQIQSISVPQNNNTVIKIDSEGSFIDNLSNFYNTVITVLSIFIVIVTWIGFIYLRNISKSDVENEVNKAEVIDSCPREGNCTGNHGKLCPVLSAIIKTIKTVLENGKAKWEHAK
ncbi:MAG: hypothetical protein LE180_06420 [Endomicrobium sp.]|uniref:hypothetical protein n=1 Tax=Candidatus Endomicrobiellum pyrsonymphae TaxID=1408203 RepID=UPI003585B851|nr:hypothetical protein [Endomicrobium sp.]